MPVNRAVRPEQAELDLHRDARLQVGRLLFGDSPVGFPITVAVVERYSDAK